MIPLKLHIEGLYSYQEAVDIDFKQLGAESIFGIFGPVGSGKSAILEAITFALYGDMARMSSVGRKYNMMNLQSDRLEIDFVFKLDRPSGEEKYRYTVQGRRNRKNHEDIRQSRQAYREIVREGKAEWLPLENASAETVLNLSYDNFSKTIIIPQGRFQEFLLSTMNDKSRTALLKELFELKRFDLYEATKRLLDAEGDLIKGLRGQLLEIPEVSNVDISLKQSERDKGRSELAQIKEDVERTAKEEESLRQLKEFQADLDENTMGLSLLEGELPEIEKREQQLKHHLEAVQQFREPFLDQERRKQRQTELAGTAGQLAEQQQQLEGEIVLAEEQFAESKRRYEGREVLKNEMWELKQIQKILELDRKIQQQSKAISNEEERLVEFQEQNQTLERERTEREEDRDKARAEAALLDDLREMERFRREKQRLEESKEAEVKGLQGRQDEVDRIEEEMKVLVNALNAGEVWEDPGKWFVEQIQVLEQRRNELEVARRKQEVEQKLAAFAEELEAGKPCPLCGAEHHPQVYTIQNAVVHLAELEAQIDHIAQQQTHLARQKSEFERLQTQQNAAQREFQQQKLKFEEAENRLELHQQQIPRSVVDWEPMTLLDEALAKAVKARSDGEQLERKMKELLGAEKKLQESTTKIKEQIQAFRQDQIAKQTQRDTLQSGLDRFSVTEFINFDTAQFQIAIAERDNKYQKYEQDFRDAERKKEELQRQQNETESDIQVNAKEAELNTQELEHISRKLDQSLTESAIFNSFDAVKKSLSQNIQIEEETAYIEGFWEQINKLRTEKERLLRQIGDRNYDLEAHNILIERLKELQLQQSEFEGKVALLSREVVQMQEQLAKRTDLLKEMKTKELRLENLELLRKLFTANRFVNYVATTLMQELVNRANDRFIQLTQNQLSLALTESNAIQVRDHLNGGHLRSVQTLSGGQTFLAALCLALALADNIQAKMESRHNFFFLDEGFGTLDPASLQLVFEALQGLRKENRTVGIISHVESLKEEIPVSLQVRNDPERGSLVKGSWE